jgi:hypothetical protein
VDSSLHNHKKFLSLSLFPVAPTLKHSTPVKRIVSLQFLNPRTVSRTPWSGDQPAARPLPTQDKHRINTGVHALSGIRIHDPSVPEGEESSCLRPRGHCDRPIINKKVKKKCKLFPVLN